MSNFAVFIKWKKQFFFKDYIPCCKSLPALFNTSYWLNICKTYCLTLRMTNNNDMEYGNTCFQMESCSMSA